MTSTRDAFVTRYDTGTSEGGPVAWTRHPKGGGRPVEVAIGQDGEGPEPKGLVGRRGLEAGHRCTMAR